MSASPGQRSETTSIPETSSVISFNGNGNGDEVERIGNSQEMLNMDGNGRLSCRQPFGCAVLEISQFNRKQETPSSVEHRMPIFVPVNESSFSTLHEDIIASRIQQFEKNARADQLLVSVQILQGEDFELGQPLSDITITNRLGFPDVVFPDVRRNDVFIKLWSGEFGNANNGGGGGASTGTTRSLASLTAASNSNARNVEISVELRHQDGRPFEDVLSRGAGEPNVTRFTSMVFRSNNNPSESRTLLHTLSPLV